MTLPFFSFAIGAFLNLAKQSEIYTRIKCDEIFRWFKVLVEQNSREYVDKCIIAIIYMIEYAKYEDYLMYAEDIIEFITKKIICNCKVNDPLLDKTLILIRKIIRIKGLIYKVAKIEVLFQSLFSFLEQQRLSDEVNFQGYFKVWEMLQNFFDSRECLSYLIKYGLVRIIKLQLNYFQDAEQFYEDVKAKRRVESVASL